MNELEIARECLGLSKSGVNIESLEMCNPVQLSFPYEDVVSIGILAGLLIGVGCVIGGLTTFYYLWERATEEGNE